MSSTNFRTLLALIMLVLSLMLSTLSEAQVSGGGLGYDGAPWNPSNWSITITKSGHDETHGWHLANGIAVPDDATHAWPSPVAHPAVFDVDPRYSAQDSTGDFLGCNASSYGDVTITFNWVSPYPRPDYVIVRLYSSVVADCSSGSSISLDNGLGTVPVISPDGSTGGCAGFQLRKLQVSNGAATVTVHTSGTVASTGPISIAGVESGMVDGEIEPKAVIIEPWVSPTYGGPGPGDIPIVVSNPDPTDITMRVGLNTVTPDFMYSLDGSLHARTWGYWSMPTPSWAWTDVIGLGSDPWTAVIQRTYLNTAVADIAKNGPIELQNSATVYDADGPPRTAQVKIYVYAPQQYPIMTASTTAYDGWQRVSAKVHRIPIGTTTITESIAHARAITKSLTVGGGSVGTTKDSPIVIALNIPTFQYGETATITSTQTYGYVLAAGSDDRLYFLIKRNFWKVDTGFHQMYLPDGYHGLGNHVYMHWASATKEDAERIDHEYDLGSEDFR